MPDARPPRSVVDVVGAAIVDHRFRPRRLLAAKRAVTERHAGRWELPGGKVDPGESLRDALVREIREELGTLVLPTERLIGPLHGGWWSLTEPGAQVQYRMAVWLATVTHPPRAVEGHDELRWLTRSELFSVHWLEGDLPVITAISARMAD
ncbi:NUDIX domain-containing protein [Nostocoides sp. F2B08]|uniref:(deoxy)nucleoside triphosphate pyrophosphohydrolase n=1 Tax=Nostocoides sp. F2B08 TaxID=2653936 RepID=UPI0012638FE1|nr:NUDIX domain-containing protein [Tetrasphaera sp. F2B08]KAB7746272.1 NUDIX domain-containing protein [Tetrasphaera sp. F2B08]